MATTHFQSTPVRTVGDLPAVGSAAPAFTLTGQDLGAVGLARFEAGPPAPEAVRPPGGQARAC